MSRSSPVNIPLKESMDEVYTQHQADDDGEEEVAPRKRKSVPSESREVEEGEELEEVVDSPKKKKLKKKKQTVEVEEVVEEVEEEEEEEEDDDFSEEEKFKPFKIESIILEVQDDEDDDDFVFEEDSVLYKCVGKDGEIVIMNLTELGEAGVTKSAFKRMLERVTMAVDEDIASLSDDD